MVYADTVQTASGYSATASIGVTMKAAAATAPAIAEAGVVNGASLASGIAAGSWVAIFGQNLAAGTRALTSDDLVNGNMPTSLGGVSVNVNSQAAFLYYLSPTQINLLAPADSNTGAVAVTVTNSGGTSAAVSATLLAVAPALFASSGNVAAVRADGTVIDRSTMTASQARSSNCTDGFGATSPAVAPGASTRARRRW